MDLIFGSYLYHVRLPQSARTLVAYKTLMAPESGDTERTFQAAYALLFDVIEHVQTKDKDEDDFWESTSRFERKEFLETHLGVRGVLHLLQNILAASSYTQAFLDEIEAHLDLALGEGCECRVCTYTGPRGEGPSHTQRKKYHCKYADTPLYVWSVLGDVTPVIESITLDDPYHLYQLYQVYVGAKGRARRALEKELEKELEKDTKRSKESEDILQKRGYI